MAWTTDQICKIAAELEMKTGFYVNLGIGIPTNVSNFVPKDVNILLQSENGMLGMGPFPYPGDEDADLINAGKQTITELPESSYFDSAYSFAMIRGGHIDLTILGALQVSEKGDLANWTVPGKIIKGMGGAMDLVANVKRVVILMEHVAKDGSAKLLKECTFPLTGKACVDRIITDLGIMDIDQNGMHLVRIADGVTLEEIKAKTEANFSVNC